MVENIKVFTHSSIRVQSGNKAIYIDPFEMKEAPHDADLILITHDHHDHFSPNDISKVSKAETVLVVPEKMAKKAEDAAKFVARIETIAQGDAKEVEGLKIETVPAYNTLKPFHMKSTGWVGYIFEANGKRIYIAGDTEDIPEMSDIKDIDIAFLPCNQPYTMTVNQLVNAARRIKPKVLFPYHYGQTDLSTVPSLLKDDEIEVRIRHYE